MPGITRNMGVGKMVRQGSNSATSVITMLAFIVAENQTAVGTITEEGATAFTITNGSADFDVNSSGVITFKVAPNYQVKSQYTLDITSSAGKKYSISVTLTDVLSTFMLNTSTVLNLATAV